MHKKQAGLFDDMEPRALRNNLYKTPSLSEERAWKPTAQGAGLGAAAGAAGGLLWYLLNRDKKKRLMPHLLSGAAVGAGMGGALGYGSAAGRETEKMRSL